MQYSSQIPLISVLMPVYNAESYVCEAIESILNQSFMDFEFIIINDGSSDNSESKILSYTDKRIRYYNNDINKGLVYTLNKGLGLCKGKYIARMDADDISFPERFEKQARYLEDNPKIVGCGAFFSIYGSKAGVVDVAYKSDDIRIDMSVFCQFAHSMMMLRKSVLDENSLCYKEEYKNAEDYKLWIDMLKYGDLVNIPEVLGQIRICDTGISKSNSVSQNLLSNKIKLEHLNNLGIYPSCLLSSLSSKDVELLLIRETLLEYLPLIKQCKRYNWLYKNYISILKSYFFNLSYREKCREFINMGIVNILSMKDICVILFK